MPKPFKPMRIEDIEEKRGVLLGVLGPWEPDSYNNPPLEFTRNDGMGHPYAIVDLRLGGYQSAPAADTKVVGWKAGPDRGGCRGGQGSFQAGILIVADFPSLEVAIEKAKQLADEGLVKIGCLRKKDIKAVEERCETCGAVLSEDGCSEG
tara:strand:- start:730 stop:1179 length:450 start_codon:yes stop_codon:yes gene_type:complete